jgi:hypothetical protein
VAKNTEFFECTHASADLSVFGKNRCWPLIGSLAGVGWPKVEVIQSTNFRASFAYWLDKRCSPSTNLPRSARFFKLRQVLRSVSTQAPLPAMLLAMRAAQPWGKFSAKKRDFRSTR